MIKDHRVDSRNCDLPFDEQTCADCFLMITLCWTKQWELYHKHCQNLIGSNRAIFTLIISRTSTSILPKFTSREKWNAFWCVINIFHGITSRVKVYDLFAKGRCWSLYWISCKTFDAGLQISQASENVCEFFRSYSELPSKCGTKSFQKICFNGDLIFRLRRITGDANFITSGSKIIKRLRRRQNDPVIMERTMSWTWVFYLVQTVPEALHSD